LIPYRTTENLLSFAQNNRHLAQKNGQALDGPEIDEQMKNILWLLIFSGWSWVAFPQSISERLWQSGGKLPDKIEIPFEYSNNLILVKVVFNRVFPLKFIFDTGAEFTILTHRQFTDILQIPYERDIRIVGADMDQTLLAHLITNIHLQIGPHMVLPRHPMLVLEEDYFRYEEMTGTPIHGIIGADVFRNFVVKINYKTKLITLIRHAKFKPPHDYTAIPIEVYKNRPFLTTPLRVYSDTLKNAKFLLDTGASVAVIINTNSGLPLQLPPTLITGRIGIGLGGYLDGYLGRIQQMNIGEYQLHEVLTSFQELPGTANPDLLNGRNGTIGNQVLSRFHLIFDYWHQTLYVKPNKWFKKAFKYDKSGIVVIASGMHFDRFIVHDVLPGSPAFHAGVRRGDQIVSLNRMPVSFFGLKDITAFLSKKEGKKIRLGIKRNGRRIFIRFRLKKLV